MGFFGFLGKIGKGIIKGVGKVAGAVTGISIPGKNKQQGEIAAVNAAAPGVSFDQMKELLLLQNNKTPTMSTPQNPIEMPEAVIRSTAAKKWGPKEWALFVAAPAVVFILLMVMILKKK